MGGYFEFRSVEPDDGELAEELDCLLVGDTGGLLVLLVFDCCCCWFVGDKIALFVGNC